MSNLFEDLDEGTIVNVASVPMRSPFRYPGGKTWLIPRIRQWLSTKRTPELELVEPFAGGGIVSLTAAFERLARLVTLVEIDPDVAAVWQTILNGKGNWLAERIESFQVTAESVNFVLANPGDSYHARAFSTILRNRVSRGGIIAPGAGIVKNGENGKGLTSRWYPQTLKRRVLDIVSVKEHIRVVHGDGMEHLRSCIGQQNAVFFIDPPYTVAGRRLYTYSEIDHAELFEIASELTGDFLMTYDESDEIRTYAARYGFQVRSIAMKNTHHAHKRELLISRDMSWLID